MRCFDTDPFDAIDRPYVGDGLSLLDEAKEYTVEEITIGHDGITTLIKLAELNGKPYFSTGRFKQVR